MKNQFARILSIILLASVLALTLGACNALKPMTAMEVMQKSAENTNQVKSLKYQLTVGIDAAGQALEMKGDGVVQMPDQSYATMDVLGQTVETLQLGKDEIYVRTAGTEAWQPVTQDQLAQSGLNTDVLSQQNMYFEFYQDAQLGEEEQVNGVDCYHVTFNLDLTGLLDKMMQAEVRSMIDTTGGSASGESWVSKKDLLIQKVSITMNYVIQGQAVKSTTLMEYSDFNEPVEIPTP